MDTLGRACCSLLSGLLASSAAVVGLALAAAPSLFLADDFEEGLASFWTRKSVMGMRPRGFQLFTEPGGNHCLMGASQGDFAVLGIEVASLGRPLKVQQYPLFSWCWKVSRVLESADARTKQGDDFAARFYVVFERPSWRPGDVRVIVYVWDNREPVGAVLPNTWAPGKEMMIVLESGPQRADKWVCEERDVYRDFKRAFPEEEPGRVQALAVACDTDQTGEEVTLYFDDLSIARLTPGDGSTIHE